MSFYVQSILRDELTISHGLVPLLLSLVHGPACNVYDISDQYFFHYSPPQFICLHLSCLKLAISPRAFGFSHPVKS